MNKKLFELDEGTPDGSMKFAYGKVGEAAKNITLDNLKDLIVPGALKTMVKDIGAWDMNTVPTLMNQIYLYSGMTGIFQAPFPVGKIRSVSVLIISDNGRTVTDLLSDIIYQSGLAVTGVQAINITYHPVSAFPLVLFANTEVQLTRRTGGMFDNTSYSSTAINRGWVKIEYVE